MGNMLLIMSQTRHTLGTPLKLCYEGGSLRETIARCASRWSYLERRLPFTPHFAHVWRLILQLHHISTTLGESNAIRTSLVTTLGKHGHHFPLTLTPRLCWLAGEPFFWRLSRSHVKGASWRAEIPFASW